LWILLYILSLSLWLVVNLFCLTRPARAWGLGTWGEMSGSLHTSKGTPQGTLMQISLPHQHSMVWNIRNQSASYSAIFKTTVKKFKPVSVTLSIFKCECQSHIFLSYHRMKDMWKGSRGLYTQAGNWDGFWRHIRQSSYHVAITLPTFLFILPLQSTSFRAFF